MTNKLAYVSGPYRAPTIRQIIENIRSAEDAMIWLLQNGIAVICPHKNTALLDGVIPEDEWVPMDLVMLRRCDIIVMVKNWKLSEGARIEYDCAVENGLELWEYVNWEDGEGTDNSYVTKLTRNEI